MKAYAGKEVLLHPLSTGFPLNYTVHKNKNKNKTKKKDPQYVNQQIYFKFNMLFVNNKLNETHILLVKQQIIGKPYLH